MDSPRDDEVLHSQEQAAVLAGRDDAVLPEIPGVEAQPLDFHSCPNRESGEKVGDQLKARRVIREDQGITQSQDGHLRPVLTYAQVKTLIGHRLIRRH